MMVTDQECRELWIPATDLLNGLELTPEYRFDDDSQEPHMRLNELSVRMVGAVERMLQECFPDKFTFRILHIHSMTLVDLGIFAHRI